MTLENIIAEAEVALAKENNTTPPANANDTTIAPEPESTIAGTESQDTVEAAPNADTLPAATAEPEAKKKPWFVVKNDKEIEKNRKLAEENAALKAALEKQPKTVEQIANEEIETRANQRAKEIAQNMNFQEKVTELGNKGRAKHTNFNEAAENLQSVGLTDEKFLNIAMKLPAAEDVLYYLGMNSEEAVEIAGLDPIDQTLRLKELELKLVHTAAAPKPQISKAPAPVKPIAGSGASSNYTGDDPEMLLGSDEASVTKFWNNYYKRNN